MQLTEIRDRITLYTFESTKNGEILGRVKREHDGMEISEGGW